MRPAIRHSLGVLFCAALVVAYEWVAWMMWITSVSLGTDNQVAAHAERVSRIGEYLLQPFLVPMGWLTPLLHDNSMLPFWRRFLCLFALPLAYGGCLYCACFSMYRRFLRPVRYAQGSSNEPTTAA